MNVKRDIKSKADKVFVSELERRIIDQQNRSRHNNVVLWNVPEGSKKDVAMVEIIQNLLLEHMELDGAEDIEIMRAQCMPVTVRKGVSKLRPKQISS